MGQIHGMIKKIKYMKQHWGCRKWYRSCSIYHSAWAVSIKLLFNYVFTLFSWALDHKLFFFGYKDWLFFFSFILYFIFVAYLATNNSWNWKQKYQSMYTIKLNTEMFCRISSCVCVYICICSFFFLLSYS